ncbi:MAG: hypothetical protein D6712_14620, partial [Chloroflexi bacterium]
MGVIDGCGVLVAGNGVKVGSGVKVAVGVNGVLVGRGVFVGPGVRVGRGVFVGRGVGLSVKKIVPEAPPPPPPPPPPPVLPQPISKYEPLKSEADIPKAPESVAAPEPEKSRCNSVCELGGK